VLELWHFVIARSIETWLLPETELAKRRTKKLAHMTLAFLNRARAI